MPTRPDEDALWLMFGPGRKYQWPRDAAVALGMPTNRMVYLLNKWADQGRYEWGTTMDLGWKVET